MRDLIVLAGGYRLDTRNASAARALALDHMRQDLGCRMTAMVTACRAGNPFEPWAWQHVACDFLDNLRSLDD